MERNEKSKCTYCASGLVPHVDKIKIHHSKRNQKINQTIFCDSKFVIYIAECKICKLQSVGSTVNFNKRIAKYKRNILNKVSTAPRTQPCGPTGRPTKPNRTQPNPFFRLATQNLRLICGKSIQTWKIHWIT